MDTVTGILSQLAPAAAIETTLFSVPRDGNALIQELVVCNRLASTASFRVSISPRGAATAVAHYIYFDMPVSGNDTFAAELELTLSSFDVIRVYSSSGSLSFTLFGVKT